MHVLQYLSKFSQLVSPIQDHCSNQQNVFPYQGGSFLLFLPREEKKNSENMILSADGATLDVLCRLIYISLPSTRTRFIFQGFSLEFKWDLFHV